MYIVEKIDRMTRKTALREAISVVKNSGIDEKTKENIVKKLELCIGDCTLLCGQKWRFSTPVTNLSRIKFIRKGR